MAVVVVVSLWRLVVVSLWRSWWFRCSGRDGFVVAVVVVVSL